MNPRYGFYAFCLLLIAAGGTACRKAVEVSSPSTSLASAAVYTSNATAASAVTGIYEKMMGGTGTMGGPYSMTALLGASADELQIYPGSPAMIQQAYTNSLTSTSGLLFWNSLYNYIYMANSAIQGLGNSNGVSAGMKEQLMGEAKFIRAFCHFYLVNIFGDVPLVTSTDYRVNEVISRTPKAQVYQQIVADLKDAQGLLSDNFLSPAGGVTTERVRPNKGAATALLARTYLYLQQWDSAAAQATKVIGNTNYSIVNNPDSVFLKNSREAIWQLQPVVTSYNTFDGFLFVLAIGPNTSLNPFYLSSQLQGAFETGDKRKARWVGNYRGSYYYPYKYKASPLLTTTVTEYQMVFRLAEQYLIRAEAEAQLGDITDAQTDLDVIRARAGLPATTASTQTDLLTAILHERQVELFTEWGHRWLDLKRTGNLDAVMSIVTPQKGGSWNTNWQWYPLALTELQADPNLTQNPGYN